MKRILLISYYFAPCPAIGAKRWSEMYRLLQNDEEFETTVLTANWSGEKSETGEIVYLGEEVTFRPFHSINREWTFFDALRHPSLVFRSLERGMFSDPWYEAAREWIDGNRDRKYDIVIASYTPLNAIRLGSFAAGVYGAKYIADMRDMMSLQGQKIRWPLVDAADRMLDRFWLRRADHILSVGPTICEKASKFYGRKVERIYNAFPLKELKSAAGGPGRSGRLVFSYMGTLGIRRNPRGILHWLEEWGRAHPETEIVVNFASQDDPGAFVGDLEFRSVSLRWLGYLDRAEIGKLKEETDCFLLLEDTDIKGKENVTGKLFEYMAGGKPVLAYCHPESDIGEILEDSGIGSIVAGPEDLEAFLPKLVEGGFAVDSGRLAHYSREAQYEKLKEILMS